jgi:hypothetical protein
MARAPTGMRRKVAPPVDVCARSAAEGMTPAASAKSATATRRAERERTADRARRGRFTSPSDGRCLVDQHDGYVIAHGVAESASVADETVLALSIFELALALGTDENLEQRFGKAHVDDSSGGA